MGSNSCQTFVENPGNTQSNLMPENVTQVPWGIINEMHAYLESEGSSKYILEIFIDHTPNGRS